MFLTEEKNHFLLVLKNEREEMAQRERRQRFKRNDERNMMYPHVVVSISTEYFFSIHKYTFII